MIWQSSGKGISIEPYIYRLYHSHIILPYCVKDAQAGSKRPVGALSTVQRCCLGSHHLHYQISAAFHLAGKQRFYLTTETSIQPLVWEQMWQTFVFCALWQTLWKICVYPGTGLLLAWLPGNLALRNDLLSCSSLITADNIFWVMWLGGWRHHLTGAQTGAFWQFSVMFCL